MAKGNFKIEEQEYVKQELVINGDFTDGLTSWRDTSNTTVVDGVAIYDSYLDIGYGQLSQYIMTSGKKYILTYDYKTNGSYPKVYNGSTYIVRPHIVDNEWHNMKIEFTSEGTLFKFRRNSAVENEPFYVDNISIQEVQYLPTETKYMECTTDGTIARQSKQAYGEWEFDFNKVALNNNVISFVNSAKDSTGERYSIQLSGSNRIYFYADASTYFYSASGYFDDSSWYRLKVARLQSEGVFKDIPTLQTSDLVNSETLPYAPFNSNGRYGFNAVSDGTNFALAGTEDKIDIVNTVRYLIEFDLKLNSGTAPRVDFRTAFGATLSSDFFIAVDGKNSSILTATSSTEVILQFWNEIGGATDFEVSGLTIRRIYPANTFAMFIKGGDFGETYTLISGTGGYGSLPLTNSTHKTSDVAVLNMGNGDKITNLLFKKQVEQ